VLSQTNVKRAIVLMTLAGLIVIEIGLLESFLPYEWQHAISRRSEQIFPTQKYEPYPDMGGNLNSITASIRRTGSPCMDFLGRWCSELRI
jgi:hypothetical protein